MRINRPPNIRIKTISDARIRSAAAWSMNKITPREITELSLRIFGIKCDESIAKGLIQNRTPKMLAFASTAIRALDTGHRREGGIIAFFEFCERNEQDFPIVRLMNSPRQRRIFIDLLEQTFPAVRG